MDITTISTTSIKTPEAESETPTRIQPPKPIHTNGLLKRHLPIIQPSLQPPPQPLPVFSYRDCLKNHAAHIGGHALDGCGEFMPTPPSNPPDPTTLRCAACGCHRNFHRRETELNHHRAVAEFHSPNRHQPPPPPQVESPNSPSPPPISSSYYPTSAPHMLLALSSAPQPVAHHTPPPVPHSNSRKRFRTKFTHHQKEKMLEFAGKVGWKIQKRDETAISDFCNEIGVDRSVLKVWMHNNKSTLGRTENHGNKRSNNGHGHGHDNSSSGSEEKMEEQKNREENAGADGANGNGSSTSS